MRRELATADGTTPCWCRPLLATACLSASLLASGCGGKEKSQHESASKPPAVKIMHPEVRTLIRYVGQPSFVEAYERTSIYPKLTGYIEKWVVDIGDRVKKGQMLARLFVPELIEDFGTKKATVVLDEQRLEMAKQVVEVATADTKAARARFDEAGSMLAKYQAEADRWETEVKRLSREVSRGVVDAQVLLESTNQFKSSSAARDAAKATIRTADAEVASYEAKYSKARVDVGVAGADLAVATSESKRIEAWVGYMSLTAPFDGVIVARNANTFDFVQPGTGDPTADPRSPYRSPSGNSAPIYVVDRTDVIRVFVDIPEQDANYVHVGTTATVLVKGYRDEPIKGTVTRTAWALNIKSRTLRAEIDLPNPNSQILPGMYAFANVVIIRPNVRAVPINATTYTGDKTFCWMYKDGKAQRTEIRTGINDGQYIEVTSLNSSSDLSDSKVDQPWVSFGGAEQVIVGDLTVLTEGGPVDVMNTPVREPKNNEKPTTTSRPSVNPSVAIRN